MRIGVTDLGTIGTKKAPRNREEEHKAIEAEEIAEVELVKLQETRTIRL